MFCFFRTISQLNNYLQDTADKQTKARGVLKDYMEELMERAETAESEMETLKRSFRGATPAPRCLQRASSQSDWKLDNGDYDRHTGNKYEVIRAQLHKACKHKHLLPNMSCFSYFHFVFYTV